MGTQLRIILKQSLLPPGIVLWLIAAGLLSETYVREILWLAFLILYFFSIAPVANKLLQGLEYYPPLDGDKPYSEAVAIIVIGGGLPRHSPEFPGYQPTALTLERVRYAAFLHKKTGLPLLTSGGGPKADGGVMADTLGMDYSIDVKYRENQSLNTWQNALFSKKKLNVTEPVNVILVTHAWHMPRAVMSFRHAGFNVIPAPTAFTGKEVSWGRLVNWMPRAKNMRLCELALHEYLGLFWYRLSFLLRRV